MPSTRTFTHAAEAKAMSIDELAAFVQDALRAGAGAEIPKVRLNFGSTIKSTSVDLHPQPTDQPS